MALLSSECLRDAVVFRSRHYCFTLPKSSRRLECDIQTRGNEPHDYSWTCISDNHWSEVSEAANTALRRRLNSPSRPPLDLARRYRL